MKKGDIILVPFPFTNLQGIKRRPAVVLYNDERDAVVAFITSRVEAEKEFDVYVAPNPNNGLKKASLIKMSKLATLDFQLIIGKLGFLEEKTLLEVDKELRLLLDL